MNAPRMLARSALNLRLPGHGNRNNYAEERNIGALKSILLA
jgi:hypothetical protein